LRFEYARYAKPIVKMFDSYQLSFESNFIKDKQRGKAEEKQTAFHSLVEAK